MRTVNWYREITDLIDHEKKYNHVSLSDARISFFERLIYCANRDEEFAKILETQLSLYCLPPDNIAFFETCNSPKHVLRNRMIVFEIDHPELKA